MRPASTVPSSGTWAAVAFWSPQRRGQRVYDTLTFGEVELFEPFLLSPLNLPLQLPRDTTHTTQVAALAESSDIKLNSFQSHLQRNTGTGQRILEE